MADIKRQVAVKAWIKELTSSSYVQESDLRPNYVLTQDNKKISRVNLLGAVVSLDQTGLLSFVLDDGSSTITIRSFEQNPAWKVELGEVVLVVGRPRQYGTEIYVLPEIIKKIDNKNWIEVRKIELGETTVVEQTVQEKGSNSEVYNLIKKLDEGSGVLVDAVIEKLSDAEKIIDNLLSRGEVFEVSPGRIKVLD